MHSNLRAEVARARAQMELEYRADAARRALEKLRIRPAVIGWIHELHSGGLEDFEIAKHAKLPPETVRLVLLGAMP